MSLGALWIELPVLAATDFLAGDNAAWGVEGLAQVGESDLLTDATLGQLHYGPGRLLHLGTQD